MKIDLQVGDCVKLLENLKNKTVDLIIFSPPYNLGIKYSNYHDKKTDQEYMQFMQWVAFECNRILKDDGSVFINVAGNGVNPYLPLTLPLIFGKSFILQNHIVWIKSIAVKGKTHGHYKPINSKRYLNNTHESIFHFSKKGKVEIDRLAIGVPYTDKTNLKRRGHARDLKCAGNVWFIPYNTVQDKAEKFNHPATYPVELPLRCIKLHGKNKPIVLDPFCGAGSTGVAAAKYGAKHFIGMDVSKEYIKMSKKRIKEAKNV